jgi:hypothetical protein
MGRRGEWLLLLLLLLLLPLLPLCDRDRLIVEGDDSVCRGAIVTGICASFETFVLPRVHFLFFFEGRWKEK